MSKPTKERADLRCLQISKFYPPYYGGIESSVRDISVGLVERGWSVGVLCANTELRLVEEHGSVSVTRLPSFGEIAKTSITPSLVPRLYEMQRTVDVIHVHLPNPMANFALMLTRPTAKVVVHWHSDIIQQKALLQLYAPFQSWLLRRADAVIVTSPPYAECSQWLQQFKHKTFVVPNSVHDPEKLFVESARKKKVEDIRRRYRGKKIVFALGRMTQYKGFRYLIDASRLLGDDVIVLLGGSGELLEELKCHAAKTGVLNKIQFLGRLSDDEVSCYHAVADVFCLPSVLRSEAFGVVIVEAMAHRKPVVSCMITGSGVPWVNIHGQTGINVEPGNAEELANGLNQLLSNKELAVSMGLAGRRRFEEHFSTQVMIDGIERVYATVGSKPAKIQ